LGFIFSFNLAVGVCLHVSGGVTLWLAMDFNVAVFFARFEGAHFRVFADLQ
jgi:hypothetical protein